MLVHEAADYSLVNADVDRWSEHHQEVADNHSSSMLTGGDGSSERRQQVADHHSSHMVTGRKRSSEHRHQQEVTDNYSSGRIEFCVFGVRARFLYLMSYFSHSHILRNFFTAILECCTTFTIRFPCETLFAIRLACSILLKRL